MVIYMDLLKGDFFPTTANPEMVELLINHFPMVGFLKTFFLGFSVTPNAFKTIKQFVAIFWGLNRTLTGLYLF